MLEIGPFANPVVRGRNVAYFDVLDREGLRARAGQVGQDPAGVPEVDFVSPRATCRSSRPVQRRGQRPLHRASAGPVRHLEQVGDLLEPGGHYFLVVPNRLYCFDHFIADSTLAGIVAAQVEGRRVHRLESVIEHRALTTHNARRQALGWGSSRSEPSDHRPAHEGGDRRARGRRRRLCRRACLAVHPGSFRAIMAALHAGGYSPLAPLRVYETPRGRDEFTAVLIGDA